MTEILEQNNKEELNPGEILKKFTTNNSTRDKTTSLFFDVFTSIVDNIDYHKAAQFASELEREITEQKLNSSQVRSKYLNLKDVSNELCMNIYNGDIGVQEFLSMSSEEMKSKALKNTDENLIESSIEGSQVAQMEEETDLFYCFKCKERKCRYRQLQTRSADEPMTTYVFCKCGNTWKF